MELCYRNNPKSLFRKYADLVTWLAQTQIGRDYLGISNEYKDISLLLPNGYHRQDGEFGMASFYSKPIFAPKLYPALYFVDIASQFLTDFSEAQRLLLAKLGLISGKEFLPLLLKLPHFTLFSFKPNADVETVSVDGYTYRSVASETWATIIAGAGNGASDSDIYLYFRGDCSTTLNQYTNLYHVFSLFDSSSLSDTDVISSGDIQINNNGSVAGNLTAVIVTTTPASNTAIVSTDHANVGAVAQSESLPTGSMVAGYNRLRLNSTGLGNISKTSISKFGVRATEDINNSPPAWVSGQMNGANLLSADNSVNTAPILDVFYNSINALKQYKRVRFPGAIAG